MYTYIFNPFRKTLNEIKAEDLLVLRDVSEGWYVDYKKEGITTRDFAKHLSAFSNQYGGLLFIGICEADDGSRKAATFAGFPREKLELLSGQIRDAAITHASPPVIYEEHVIEGPSQEIGLPKGNLILIIGVPQGDNPPYIHSSGRIYRRLADQSKPKEETDRYILDDLWRRGKEIRSNISKFLTNTPELPEAQKDNVWAFIYIIPKLDFPDPIKELTFEKFRFYTAQSKESVAGVSLPMQSVYSARGGYIARQIEKNDPGLATLALRWWHGGIARLEIPINTWPVNIFLENSKIHRYAQMFLSKVYEQGFKNISICDFSLLIQCIAGLSNIFCHLRKEINDNRPVYATYELRNVFYKVPFVDSMKFIERCTSNGIPVIQDRVIKHSENPYFDNMLSLPNPEEVSYNSDGDKIQMYPYMFAAPIAYHILSAVGILLEVRQIVEDLEIWGHHKVNKATY